MQDMEALVKRLNTHSWRPEKGRTAVLLIDLEETLHDLSITDLVIGGVRRTSIKPHL